MTRNGIRLAAFLRVGSCRSRWALALAAGALCLSVGPAVTAGQPSPARVVADLEAFCHPETVQAAVRGLRPAVTVKEIRNGPRMPGGTRYAAAANGWPAFCQVSGSFVTHPKTGKTANFLATFPATWNGKYLQMGCSGNCGQFAVSNPAMPQVTITSQGYPGESIIKGYASFATDEGHESSAAGTWAIQGPGQVDAEALTDFYYRADKILARLGKQFTLAFYAAATRQPQKLVRAYFNGCSGGGRDAVVAASRFPEEFDGIIAGSPAEPLGAVVQMAGVAVATLRSEDADMPAGLVALIDPIVKAQCDKLDGVEDGLIQNPMACDFRPERDLPTCADNKPGAQCFTQAQIQTLSTLLTAVTDEHGTLVQPGYTVSEVQAASFLTPKRPTELASRDPFPNSDTGGQAGGYWPLADAFIRVFVHKNDPEFFTRSMISFREGGPGSITDYRIVVPKAEVERIRSEAGPSSGHSPEQAAKLIRQNRKFLIWHNLSDQVLTPYMSINYYKRLAQLHGGYAQLQNTVRLFGIPGSGHCSMMGVGPDNFDALTAMEDWVEKGQAPDALLARLYDPNSPMIDISKTPLRTMPLCKFPEMARYSGKGDVKDAANWSCPANDTSMSKVGASGRRAGIIE
jgi:feruloyl esterase